MRLVELYSHLNGWEYLQVRRPHVWGDVEAAIDAVDAEACRTKTSKEKRSLGALLYSPPDMNTAFKREFEARGWRERRNTFWVTADAKLLRGIHNKTAGEQKQTIIDAGHEPISSYNQTDFVKEASRGGGAVRQVRLRRS